MIVYPHAKINIGLHVTKKREDGFHDLKSVFYPITLCDILEVVKDESKANGEFIFTSSGITLDCNEEKNLVVKAYQLLHDIYNLPAVKIHLHKVIPFGAGLGGGSSDAAFMLKALNDMFALGINLDDLAKMSATLGSDCPFFIYNKPQFIEGRGDKLSPTNINLEDFSIILIKPEFGISTADAFGGIKPLNAEFNLRELHNIAVEKWRDTIANDFEKTVFVKYPLLNKIKQSLYKKGALFASMSGSGSTIFAIFEKNSSFNLNFTLDTEDYTESIFVWKSN